MGKNSGKTELFISSFSIKNMCRNKNLTKFEIKNFTRKIKKEFLI